MASGWADAVYLQGGLGTHWSDSDDYKGTQWLVGVEVSREDKHRSGIALFNNSLDQFSQHYYYGYKWQRPFLGEGTHVKLTGGLIYGYVDEFEAICRRTGKVGHRSSSVRWAGRKTASVSMWRCPVTQA